MNSCRGLSRCDGSKCQGPGVRMSLVDSRNSREASGLVRRECTEGITLSAKLGGVHIRVSDLSGWHRGGAQIVTGFRTPGPVLSHGHALLVFSTPLPRKDISQGSVGILLRGWKQALRPSLSPPCSGPTSVFIEAHLCHFLVM